MKIRIVSALAAITLTFTSTAIAEPGRWQLFQGEYTVYTPGQADRKIRELFKIDTSTGELYTCYGLQERESHANQSLPKSISQTCTKFETAAEVRRSPLDGL